MNVSESAQALLNSLWKDKTYPVDPVWIANELGISVKESDDLPDNISAAIIKDEGKDPVILLSANDSRNRKRFSCAHEIGHYIFHTNNKEKVYEYIDLRSGQSSAGTNPEEIFANQFAACLLMPEDEVKRLQKSGTPPFLIAQFFGVSEEAINIRLTNLHCNE
jgi:Zn-dependent peptidase ImmA (M78 family)